MDLTANRPPMGTVKERGRPHSMPSDTPEFRELIKNLIVKHNGNFEKINIELRAADADLSYSSRRSYFRHIKQMGIAGPRKGGLEGSELHEAIQLLADPHKNRGFRGMHHALSMGGVLVTQQAVARAQKEINSDSVASRQLKSKKQLFRSPIITAGPNEQWSVDGHDKLAAYGFGIYGIRDVYSGFILALHAFPSNRKATNVHWLYLKTVQAFGGIPIQIAADRGSETGLMLETQSQLRRVLSDHELLDIPPFILLPSTRNITIERAWIGVRNDVVRLCQNKFDEGLRRGFVASNETHCAVFWFVFAPLVQGQLDLHRDYQNTYKVRKQKEKLNPSGARRCEIYTNPAPWAGRSCLLNLDQESEEEVCAALCDAEQQAELAWITPEVQELCQQVLLEHNRDESEITMSTAWDFFSLLLPVVRERLSA